MNEPLITIAVIPRERFGLTATVLDALYTHTEIPFRLVCVDGGSPRRVYRQLQARAAKHDFLLIRKDHFLSPNQARNIALRKINTRYVVFVDNDVLVTPGWLQSLVDCAEQTGCAICGPLQLIGPLQAERIHIAGGIAHIAERDGRRTLIDEHRLCGRRVSDVRAALQREPCEQIEFHCMLARTDLFRDIGLLDEQLLNVHEHTDLCLLARHHGYEVYFEPASMVSYLPPDSFTWHELRYFMLRWSEIWTQTSIGAFTKKWNLPPDDPGLESTLNFARWQRKLVWRRYYGRQRWLGRYAGSRLVRYLLRPPAQLIAALIARDTLRTRYKP